MVGFMVNDPLFRGYVMGA